MMDTVGFTDDLSDIGSMITKNCSQEGSVDVQRWISGRHFTSGRFNGTRPTNRTGSLSIVCPFGEREYTDLCGHGTKIWVDGWWISPIHLVRFGAKELIASWTADTPPGTWLEVEMRGPTT